MDVAQSAGIELLHFLSHSTGHLGRETMTWIYSAALQFDNMNSWLFVGLNIATPMLQLLIRGSRFVYPGDCPTPSISAFKILEIRSVLLTNLMLSDVCLQFVRVLSSSAHSDYCQDVDIFFRFGRHEV